MLLNDKLCILKIKEDLYVLLAACYTRQVDIQIVGIKLPLEGQTVSDGLWERGFERES